MISETHNEAIVQRFDSLSEYLGQCENPDGSCQRGLDWDGGLTPREAFKKATDGDPSCVDTYKGEIAKLASAHAAEMAFVTRPDVWGSRVHMPSFIAGRPDCMRRRQKRERETRVVRIFVSLVCSGGIPADTMLKRGAAVLALIEWAQASQFRVEVSLVAELPCSPKDHVQIIPLDVPLDLSRTGFVIAHPAFVRHTLYIGGGRQLGFNGGWVRYDLGFRGGYDPDPNKRYPVPRRLIGCEPSDVFVGMAHLHDLAVKDPKKWLATHVSQILGSETEAA